MLKPDALPYLQKHETLARISHKGHQKIFSSIFEELAENGSSLRVRAVEALLPVIAEQYQAVFTAQTERFYLSEGVLKKLLEKDPKALDGVPVNSLGGEHQVAEVLDGQKRAATAEIGTVGRQQVIAKSAYMRQSKGKTRKDLKELFKFARKDPRAKMAKRLFEFSAASGRLNQERKLMEKQAKKIKAALSRKTIVIKCKANHGGPATTVADLHLFLETKTLTAEKQKVCELEIFYQRDNIYQEVIVPDKSVFKVRRMDASGKGMPKKPLPELIKNITELLDPETIFQSSVPVELPMDDFCNGMVDLLAKVTSTNLAKRGSAPIPEQELSVKEGNFVAVYWMGHDDKPCWYLGKVTRVFSEGDCQYCEAEDEKYGERKDTPCYDVLYLTKTNNGYTFENPQGVQEFHTLHDLVLSTVTMKASGKYLTMESPSTDTIDRILGESS